MFSFPGSRRPFAEPLVAGTLVAALAVWPASAWAQGAAGVDVLRDIAKAWEQREEQLNPIWVRYRLTCWESVAWQKAKRRDATDRELRWTDEGEYAHKGVKTRSWVHSGRPTISRPWDVEGFYIYNGEVQIEKNDAEDTYSIHKQAQKLYIAETPFEIAGERVLREELRMWKEGDAVTTSVAENRGDGGERVVVLEFHSPNGFWDKHWLLPDRGWALRRHEAYNPKNGPIYFDSVQEFGDAHGVVYPNRGRRETYLSSRDLARTIDFEVESIETQAARVPDSLFIFDIPKTASVWDDDLKVMVRNTDVTESHLKDVVARAAGHGGWGWWALLSLGTGLVALAAAGYWFLHRRKRLAGPAAVPHPK